MVSFETFKGQFGDAAPLVAISTPALGQVWQDLYPCERNQWQMLFKETKTFARDLIAAYGHKELNLDLAAIKEAIESYVVSTETAWKIAGIARPFP